MNQFPPTGIDMLPAEIILLIARQLESKDFKNAADALTCFDNWSTYPGLFEEVTIISSKSISVNHSHRFLDLEEGELNKLLTLAKNIKRVHIMTDGPTFLKHFLTSKAMRHVDTILFSTRFWPDIPWHQDQPGHQDIIALAAWAHTWKIQIPEFTCTRLGPRFSKYSQAPTKSVLISQELLKEIGYKANLDLLHEGRKWRHLLNFLSTQSLHCLAPYFAKKGRDPREGKIVNMAREYPAMDEWKTVRRRANELAAEIAAESEVAALSQPDESEIKN